MSVMITCPFCPTDTPLEEKTNEDEDETHREAIRTGLDYLECPKCGYQEEDVNGAAA